MLLETGGKGILLIWWQKIYVELCSAVEVWKERLVNNELGHLAEISSQRVEVAAWFLLAVFSNM